MKKTDIQRNRSIPMRDLVRLKADVYLPSDISSKVPALICFSPYGKEVQGIALERKPLRTGQAMFDQTVEITDMPFLLENGYAIVIVSPRGVGNSEGVNHGLLSEQDQEDCCEVISWAAKEPWCNGNVGMVGTGFAGRIQPLVAAKSPQALKAIMPIDVIDDLYAEYYPGGLVTDYSFGYDGMIPANRWECESIHTMGEQKFREKLEELKKSPKMIASSYTWRAIDSWPVNFHPFTVDCLVNDTNNDFWKKRSFNSVVLAIKIPVYVVSYLYEFGRSTISAINLFNNLGSNSKRLMLVEAGFNKRQPCDQVNEQMLMFYDYYLKEENSGLEQEKTVKIFVMGKDEFIEGDAWPVCNTQEVKYHLSEENKLSTKKGCGKADILNHQPPTKVSQTKQDIPFIEYETDAFEKDTSFCGTVQAVLQLGIDKPDANINVFIWQVDENDNTKMLTSAVVKGVSESHCDIHEYNIELPPISVVIPKGSKLRVHFKSMDYPIYFHKEKRTFPLLFPSGRVIGPIPYTDYAQYKLYHEDEKQSYITFPLVELV